MHHRKPIKPPPPYLPKSPSQSHKTIKFLFIAMASILSLGLLSLLLYFTISSATSHHHNRHHSQPPDSAPASDDVPAEIIQACKATRFPDTCQSSLSHSSRVNPVIEIIQSASWVSYQNLQKAQSMIQSILDSSAGNQNRTTAAKNCIEALNNSEYRLNLTADALPRGALKDGRAWLSAGLAYQYDCWSGLKYVNDSQMVNETMAFLNSLTEHTSNALSMLRAYDVLGNDTDKWGPPKTERDGFWENYVGGGLSGFESGSFGTNIPSMKLDVTVCKSGDGCDFKTVQEAVDKAPWYLSDGKHFVIKIEEGVYEETVRIGLEKRNMVFLGDGIGKTVITGSLHVGQPGISTTNSATVGVLGDGFKASGLTIQNTAGPDAHQAVAFRSSSDLSVLENCEFLGNQDTLYAHSLRQFYNSCHIEGNVDFIFGNSASVFQDCDILVRPRQLKPEKGENNAVTAHGRTDPAQSTGFVFQNCLVNGTEEYMKLYYSKPSVHKNYLGRPWKEYSRTVVIDCILEALVTPQGWMPWSGDFALSTLYYGENGNTGLGANLTGRVTWSSKIPDEHTSTYSVQNFIQADEWLQHQIN